MLALGNRNARNTEHDHTAEVDLAKRPPVRARIQEDNAPAQTIGEIGSGPTNLPENRMSSRSHGLTSTEGRTQTASSV
eukprot:11224623-Lingulodinium_polyedra.AAC.1